MSRRALSDNLDEQRRAEEMMRRAIDLASQTNPHPNPRVGAVVVSQGKVVSEAAHARAGEAHAEVLALAAAGSRAEGATVYVTLEPCSHHGKTPPCADALIDAGVSGVVVGAIDPDSRVSGAGIARLRDAGIEVSSGLLDEEIVATDPGYFHHRRTGRPLVTLKLATTLDGQIAAADRTSKWITGKDARRNGHGLRSESDVVVVGAGTVLDDDPRLDVRLDGYTGRQPRPVVIAGRRALPSNAVVFSRDALVYAAAPLPLEVEQVMAADGEAVDLGAVIKDLGGRGYVSALVEGGATLASALLRGGHVDRIVLYLAAKLAMGRGLGAFAGEFGTVDDAQAIRIGAVTRLGEDLRIDVEVGA